MIGFSAAGSSTISAKPVAASVLVLSCAESIPSASNASRNFGAGVNTQPADHQHGCAVPGGGDRLVRALAAQPPVRITEDRLACCRNGSCP